MLHLVVKYFDENVFTSVVDVYHILFKVLGDHCIKFFM